MLHSLFPKAYRRFLSLPVLGPIADGFDDWLVANGYTRDSRRYSIRMLKHVDADLRRRHVNEVGSLTHPILHDCWRTLFKTYPCFAGTVRTLERYLAATSLIASARPETASCAALILVEEYANYCTKCVGSLRTPLHVAGIQRSGFSGTWTKRGSRSRRSIAAISNPTSPELANVCAEEAFNTRSARYGYSFDF